MTRRGLLVVGLLMIAVRATAFERTEAHAPCAQSSPERNVYFGDTHVHTAYSFDARAQGTLAGPPEAYRFARGERIGIQPYDADGQALEHVQLRRPLDFAVVTDHSELLGETQICATPGVPGNDSLICSVMRRWPGLGYVLVNAHVYSSERPARYSFCGATGEICRTAGRGPWQAIQAGAEAFYDRTAACRFTTFVGYEWTGMPNGDNIHRNVIFRNAVTQDYPTTYIETPTAEGLWAALDRECTNGKPDCDVIAIPHNSNASNGRMWTSTRDDGRPIDGADARRRARLETLVEVTQHKGDSECRAGASDELCDFEHLAFPRLSDMTSSGPFTLPPNIYVREALQQGLLLQTQLGVNPFKFGLIGASDTHFATPGRVDEDQHLGHAAGTVNARFGIPPFPDVPVFNPGGLAGVWAEENSRDALFDAMRRRETFGTSGPRMVARFFGGWSYAADLCHDPALVAKGYAGGVPMGGDLPSRPDAASAPVFVVSALRDPGGAGVPSTPLQRIQIVKGWIDHGQAREQTYEVAGDPATGASVDPTTCAPQGRGFDQLCQVWRDPAFDPTTPAFYYARVVENPSCRWSTWVCHRAAVDCAAGNVPAALAACCDPAIPRTIQERAWTAPIWFTPLAPG